MTKRQLRRLAFRVPRDESLRPILHDALLEVYPDAYEQKIAFAEAGAGAVPRIAHGVVFNPLAMAGNVPMRAGGRLHEYISLFAVYRMPERPSVFEETLRRASPLLRHSVLVYLAPPGGSQRPRSSATRKGSRSS